MTPRALGVFFSSSKINSILLGFLARLTFQSALSVFRLASLPLTIFLTPQAKTPRMSSPSLIRHPLLLLLVILLFLSSPSAVFGLDYKRALLSGNQQEQHDPATVSSIDTSHKPPPKKKRKQRKTAKEEQADRSSMGQCLSDLLGPQTQEAVHEVLGAAAVATATSELVHASLPKDAVAARVRNVYDGDTLTLADERRVRLVGIDTPELKEKQAYAVEAKAYTKDRCDKQQVWLSYASTNQHEREDHYGRVLALVWVKAPGGYLCVNEGIVAAGLARVYRPSTNTAISNWQTLVKLQSTARRQKLGVWQDFHDIDVVKTANGSAYHKTTCSHVANVHHLTTLKISAAMEQGLHPCRTCMGG
jgi:endonuclease YncB( thermonuclease family)